MLVTYRKSLKREAEEKALDSLISQDQVESTEEHGRRRGAMTHFLHALASNQLSSWDDYSMHHPHKKADPVFT